MLIFCERNNNEITLGSLFDGSGGFPLAGALNGICPVWASEIEPYPIAVTRSRFPDMRHLGSVTDIHGWDIEPVDVVTFGSPCQDLSVAGKRAGIHDGERSSLFFEAVRIIREMREATNGKYPTFAVWENVPGAFSSNDGEDFRCVLEELVQVTGGDSIPRPADRKWKRAGEVVGDGYSIAWRTLDAQYWGVPQRRKRIYLVADFAGQRAGKILFELEGVSGYTPQGFRPWQGAAGAFEESAGATGCVCLNDQGGGRMDVTEDVAATLRAENHGHPPCVMGAARFCTEHSADSRSIGYREEESPTLRAGVTPGVVIEYNPTDSRIKVKEDGICQTLCSRMGTGGNNIPLVFGISADKSNAMLSDNPHSGIYETSTSRTLDCNGGSPACNQGGMAVVALQDSMIGRADKNDSQGSGVNEGVSFTLDAADRHAVSYRMTTGTYTQALEEQPPTLMARGYKDPPVVNETEPEYIVRRLTPTECARLQGFPDTWGIPDYKLEMTEEESIFWENVRQTYLHVNGKRYTKFKTRDKLIRWYNRLHSDSSEYKMWGNGIALPCASFVMNGIANAFLSPDFYNR